MRIFLLWIIFFSHSRIKGHVFTDKSCRDYQGKLCFPHQFFSHNHRRENRDQTLKTEQRKSKFSTRPSACQHPIVRVTLDLLKTLQNDLSHMFESPIIMIQTFGQLAWSALPAWVGDSVTYLTCCGHAQNFAPVAGPADVHRSHRDEVPPSRLQLDQTLTGGHGHDRPEGLTSETNYWHHFLLNNTRVTTLFPYLHQSVKPGIKKKHTWWMNVVLKQELWCNWIMDSFQ